MRTRKKLRSKLRVAFCPPTYIVKHGPPLPKKNGSKSSCMDVHINKGSSNHSPLTPFTPQKIQTIQVNFPPQIKPKPFPKTIPRRFKCQGFGHTSADCTNRRVITLAEWESFQEKEKKGSVEKKHEEEKESCEEVIEHADEGEIFMVKEVVAGLQPLEQEPHETCSPTK